MARHKRRRRNKEEMRFCWRVGVGQFGWLRLPGEDLLCETRLFVGERGLVCSLIDGYSRWVAADETLPFQPLAAEEACAMVGIPTPACEGGGEVMRRNDPFHVERHRCALFCALTELIRQQHLPCGHSLRRGGQVEFTGACWEDPEVFAACVLERIAGGAGVRDAIIGELEATCELNQRSFRQMLKASGWERALAQLPERIRVHQVLIHAACLARLGNTTPTSPTAGRATVARNPAAGGVVTLGVGG